MLHRLKKNRFTKNNFTLFLLLILFLILYKLKQIYIIYICFFIKIKALLALL